MHNKQPRQRTVFTSSKHLSWSIVTVLRQPSQRQSFYLFNKYLVLGMWLSDQSCPWANLQQQKLLQQIFTMYLHQVLPGLREIEYWSDTCIRCHSVPSQAAETVRAKLRARSDSFHYRCPLPPHLVLTGWRQMMRGGTRSITGTSTVKKAQAFLSIFSVLPTSR